MKALQEETSSKMMLEAQPEASMEQAEKVAGLSNLQVLVASAYMAGESITSIASKFSINRSTFYAWLKIPAFYCFLNQLEDSSVKRVKRGLLSLYDDAVEAVKDCLHSDNYVAKFKAATFLIEKFDKMYVGGTDLREILQNKVKHTRSDDVYIYTSYDVGEYKRLLEEAGLEYYGELDEFDEADE